jgi:MFS family permease
MKKGLGSKTWFAIVLFSLFGQVALTIENMFFNVFIEETFNAGGNDISLMVSASAIAATLTTLFMGALSDKLGKRKIFISFGYLLWGLSIMSFAFLKVENLSKLVGAGTGALALGVGLTITFDVIMTFFGSTANDAAYNAWLTDITEENSRGKVEGINSAMPLVAILVVFGGQMLVDKNPNKWTIIFLTIGILVFLVGILGFFILHEPKLEKKDEAYFKNIFYGFTPSVIKSNKTLYILLSGMMIFSISVQVFMPYLIIYFERTIMLNNYVLVFAPAVIVAALFTALYGKYVDSKGFFKTSIFSLSVYLVGLLLLTIFTNIVFVFLGTLFMMVGYLSLGAVFQTKIRDYTPEGKVGSFQGIRIFTAVLVPMLIGPWIGSVLSGNSGGASFGVVGDNYTPSSFIFLGALIVGLLTFGIIYLANKLILRKGVKQNVEL